MEKEKLTILEALKFARHDFLNELQIVLMHIDFGNVSQAKESILKTTEIMRNQSMLERLKLPETEKWIMTFDWMFTSFHKTLDCNIQPGIRKVDDGKLVTYLENTFKTIEEVLDPLSGYEAHFDIQADDHGWLITITVAGLLPNKETKSNIEENFVVVETNSQNLWTFTIRGQ